MTDEKKAAGYNVGYGKPPEHSRFRKGKSGNPKGRPKGVRNFTTDLQAMLSMPVSVTEDGKRQKISTQHAALLRLREKALTGDQRALDRLLALALSHAPEEGSHAAGKMAPDDKAILDGFLRRNGQVPDSKKGAQDND